MTGAPALSLLDLAFVRRGQSVGEALSDSTALARQADTSGRFTRLWFAEHHNMPSIASAATSVLLAHIAANTSTIRLGSGGVMLPNHSPLVIAEQFGTLAELHPGRIDLGLGRAPGTDQLTSKALRVAPQAADQFPQDVLELQGYLSDQSRVPGITAIPGARTQVPLYILGSSLFGARLAAQLGLPYAFASHFAPDALREAMMVYRNEFRPSVQCDQPYAIAALNVIAADSEEEAAEIAGSVLRSRVRSLAARIPRYAGELDEATMDALMLSPVAEQARHMMTYSAVGEQSAIAAYFAQFAELSGADELMVVNAAPDVQQRARALEVLARL